MGICQQHCEVILECKVTESLLVGVLVEDYFYLTEGTIKDAEVTAVNKTNSPPRSLSMLDLKCCTQ